MNKETIIRILAEFSRVLLGVVFVFSGFVKAVDPIGWAIKIEEYLSSFGLGSLHFLSDLAAFNLAAIEFMLGVCLLCGVYRRYTTFLTLLMMAFMTPLTLYLALFNPVSDCGCFGDAIILTNWETFYKNVVLIAASFFVFIHNQKLKPLYTFKVYWFVALYAYLMCILFSFYNYNHLPVIDFRPYKVGANILDLMMIPESAPEDEYEYTFVYEKDGIRKEFTLDDYPQDDSAWTFVDSKTKLIKQGYIPPIEAFNIYDLQGEDVTDDLFANEEGLFLLIAAELEKASDKRVDDINYLYDYCLERNLPFFCVTGSSQEAIARWSDNTGAEYPFLLADKVLLKTIIRSNPGLVLLKGETILWKWHYNDMPEDEQLQEVYDHYLSQGEGEIKKEYSFLITNLLTFPLPLLLVWFYDYFRNRRKKEQEEQ